MKNYSDIARKYYKHFANNYTIDEWLDNHFNLNPERSISFSTKMFCPMINIYKIIKDKSYNFIYDNGYLKQFYSFRYEFNFKETKNNIFGLNIYKANDLCELDDKYSLIEREEFTKRIKIANLDEEYYEKMKDEEKLRMWIMELYDTLYSYNIDKIAFNIKDFNNTDYKECNKDLHVYPLSMVFKKSDGSIQLKFIESKNISK